MRQEGHEIIVIIFQINGATIVISPNLGDDSVRVSPSSGRRVKRILATLVRPYKMFD